MVNKPLKVEEPEVKSPEPELVEIYISPKDTDGGLYNLGGTNGQDTRLVGYIKVTKEEARDIQRRVEEYKETKEHFQDGRTRVRCKSSEVLRKQYMADPGANSRKKNWTDRYGLLDPQEWQYLTDGFKRELKRERHQLYGYPYNPEDLA